MKVQTNTTEKNSSEIVTLGRVSKRTKGGWMSVFPDRLWYFPEN